MKSIKTLTVMAAGVLALSALPQVALGTFSDSIIVSGNGGSFAAISITELDEANSPNNLWKLNDGIANIGAYGFATALVEPDGTGTISDIFGVARIAALNDPLAINGFHYYLAFMSDDNLDVPLALTWFGAIATMLPETAPGSYDARQYVDWGIFNGGIVGSAVFTSDVEVPEPTTMIAGALLLLPFGASTLRMLRKNRTA